jgi:hypothetical protein
MGSSHLLHLPRMMSGTSELCQTRFFYHFINFLFMPSEVSLNLKSLEKIGKQWAMLIWKLEWYLLLTNKAFWILVWNQVCFKLLLLY